MLAQTCASVVPLAREIACPIAKKQRCRAADGAVESPMVWFRRVRRNERLMKNTFIGLVALGWLGLAPCEAMPLRQSLAMFESGATTGQRSAADSLRGGSGEVSRFQIMPAVWRRYSKSREYDNPEVAWAVAQRILADRTADFRTTTGRDPSALELYLLWNKPGHFEAQGYLASQVKADYRQRAQRFANLLTLR